MSEDMFEGTFVVAPRKQSAVLTRPFLKWAGGKLRIVSELKKKFPKTGKRFIEPFVGAGSVSLNVDYPEYIINDVNKDLTDVYFYLQTLGVDFIEKCRSLFTPENNTRESFARLKKEFNTTQNTIRKSALFIYLNRHCFNGLCRYNGSGEFNTPIGNYEKPYFPEKELMSAFEKVKKFQIKSGDFRDIFKLVRKDDVVYCDSPYLPLSESSSFDDYSMGGFSLQSQIDLARCASEASSRGATVVVSNHWNWYAKEIYTNMFKAKITTLDVARTINCNAEKRKPVKEMIAVFKPEGQ